MSNKRKVVVTGLGALAPNGNTVAEYWKSLISGKSGIGPIESFDADNLSVKIAGELSNFDVQSYFDRKELRKLDLFTIYHLIIPLDLFLFLLDDQYLFYNIYLQNLFLLNSYKPFQKPY